MPVLAVLAAAGGTYLLAAAEPPLRVLAGGIVLGVGAEEALSWTTVYGAITTDKNYDIYNPNYLGPAVYLGLAAAALLVASGVLAWRSSL